MEENLNQAVNELRSMNINLRNINSNLQTIASRLNR